jgi:hypothetical protein
MPETTQQRVKRLAKKRYPKSVEKQNHYTYGTLTKIKKRHDNKIYHKKKKG